MVLIFHIIKAVIYYESRIVLGLMVDRKTFDLSLSCLYGCRHCEQLINCATHTKRYRLIFVLNNSMVSELRMCTGNIFQV